MVCVGLRCIVTVAFLCRVQIVLLTYLSYKFHQNWCELFTPDQVKEDRGQTHI